MELKMEIYTPALELIGVLEEYQSVIWEEKAFTAGSFSVEALLTDRTKNLLREENILWIGGDTAGVIRHYNKKAKDSAYITVKGPLLTGIIGDRILWGLYDLAGTPPEIMHHLVDDCCINPTRGDAEARKTPGLILLDPPVGGEKIRMQKTGGNLLEVLETIGAAYMVAFGVRFNPAVPRMEFWTRWGVNRSVHQNINDPVFYGTELDDVLSSEYSYDSTNYRNVALVAGEGDGKDRAMVTVEAEVPKTSEAPGIPNIPTPPEPQKVTIILAVDPQGGGAVLGGGTFAVGDSVTVTASPTDGYDFAAWLDSFDIVSANTSYTFTATADRTLTALFAASIPVYTVQVSIDPAESGVVSGAGNYHEGDTVTVSATAADGYEFTGWQENGSMVSKDEAYTFTASRNVSLTAVFLVVPVSRLPEGYTEVEYIKSDGNCYIETSVKPIPDAESTNTTVNSDTKIAVDVEFLDAPTSSSKYIVYASGSIKNSSGGTTSYRLYISWATTAGVKFMLGTASKTPVANTSLRRTALELDGINGRCNADGVSATFTNRLLAGNTSTINLFGSTSTSSRIRAKMYSCQIYKGTSLQLVRDFIPCINPSGESGLYDAVNGQFYTNIGTGAFTPGPVV